jgi:hypothetical protein
MPIVNEEKINSRIQLLKGGFKQFVNSNRLHMSAETKWILEITCLNEQPKPVDPSSSVLERANFYIEDWIFKLQTNITTNKQQWIAAMKNT